MLLLHTAGQRADGCHQLALCGQRAALNHRRGHILRHARLHQTGQNHRRAADAHQKHQRAAMAHERFKIQIELAVLLGVSGDDVHGRGEIPMRHRNARVCRYGQRAGHAGHDLKRNMVLFEQLQFLAAAAEQKAVAALEAHDAFALLCLFQQNLIDAPLRHRMTIALFADIYLFGGVRHQRENLRPYQPVIDHHFGVQNRLSALDGEQSRISRPCTDQCYLTHACFLSSVVPAVRHVLAPALSDR